MHPVLVHNPWTEGAVHPALAHNAPCTCSQCIQWCDWCKGKISDRRAYFGCTVSDASSHDEEQLFDSEDEYEQLQCLFPNEFRRYCACKQVQAWTELRYEQPQDCLADYVRLKERCFAPNDSGDWRLFIHIEFEFEPWTWQRNVVMEDPHKNSPLSLRMCADYLTRQTDLWDFGTDKLAAFKKEVLSLVGKVMVMPEVSVSSARLGQHEMDVHVLHALACVCNEVRSCMNRSVADSGSTSRQSVCKVWKALSRRLCYVVDICCYVLQAPPEGAVRGRRTCKRLPKATVAETTRKLWVPNEFYNWVIDMIRKNHQEQGWKFVHLAELHLGWAGKNKGLDPGDTVEMAIGLLVTRGQFSDVAHILLAYLLCRPDPRRGGKAWQVHHPRYPIGCPGEVLYQLQRFSRQVDERYYRLPVYTTAGPIDEPWCYQIVREMWTNQNGDEPYEVLRPYTRDQILRFIAAEMNNEFRFRLYRQKQRYKRAMEGYERTMEIEPCDRTPVPACERPDMIVVPFHNAWIEKWPYLVHSHLSYYVQRAVVQAQHSCIWGTQLPEVKFLVPLPPWNGRVLY